MGHEVNNRRIIIWARLQGKDILTGGVKLGVLEDVQQVWSTARGQLENLTDQPSDSAWQISPYVSCKEEIYRKYIPPAVSSSYTVLRFCLPNGAVCKAEGRNLVLCVQRKQKNV